MPDTMNASIHWGILGCGDVTEIKSGPALQKTPRSHLLRVMRRDAQKAADYARRHSVPGWTDDADALINDPDLNAIYIATPPSTHADYAIRAMRAGKHVLVEKPMALTSDECAAMMEVSRETGQKMCIAFYRRALERFETLRQIATDGTIGALRFVEIRQVRSGDAAPGQSWKLDPTVGGGGLFVDMQAHTIDWLRHAFGDPVGVTGLVKHQTKDHAAEDLVTFLMDFDRFVAVGACSYDGANQQEGVTIHGDIGSAHMAFFAPSPISLSLGGEPTLIEQPDPAHVHQPFMEKVVAHFLDDAPNPCSGEDGMRCTETIEAIYAA